MSIGRRGLLKRRSGKSPSGVFLALLLGPVLFLSASAEQVRPYPDPGYRRLGVYGRGPESRFDYHLVKLRLGDTFPDKKPFWAGLKAERTRQDDSHRHDVYFLYCGERTDGLEAVTARVDAWLKPEPENGYDLSKPFVSAPSARNGADGGNPVQSSIG